MNTEIANYFVALALTNAGAIIGIFVSLKVRTAVLEEKVDRLETDTDNLGEMIGTKKAKARKEAA